MGKGETDQEDQVIDEDSPEWEELNRRADAEKEEFKRIVLEDPEAALKLATLHEVIEGITIVDRSLQQSLRPQERQRRVQELAQNIITYKTGKEAKDKGEGWSSSLGISLREVLFQHGLVPREYLPSRGERIKSSLGEAVGSIVDEARVLKDTPRAAVRAAQSPKPPETGQK
jgi:hypothetical protein